MDPKDQSDTATEPVEMAASDLGVPGFSTEPPPAADNYPEFALPPWLIDADAEETRELEALGVVISPTFAEDAQRDVLVSQLLRAHHEHDSDVTRYDDAEKLEHEQITRRYDRLRAPGKRQMARLASFLLHIISGVTFTGKNKSRNVGWGSFGKRKQPDKVEITNLLDAVMAVTAIDPKVVSVAVTTNIDLVTRAERIISTLVTNGAVDGTVASTLSEVRAALMAGAPALSKTDVGRLLKVPHVINGATIVVGTDKSWFEVEPPTNG